MILEKTIQRYSDFTSDTYITSRQLLQALEKRKEFKDDLVKLFQINQDTPHIVPVGNAKFLLNAIVQIDNRCDKIDIDTAIKDIHLLKMLEGEKATFEIFSISDDFILNKNKSDILEVETRYSSKADILDLYNFNKFANYCRDMEFEDLIDYIKSYLNSKNSDNLEQKKLRLIFNHEDNKCYLRAMTSTQGYQDFGLNFSIFVALISLGRYVESTKNEIYISHFSIDDSSLYVSFALDKKVKINSNLSLTFNLILENDEIKRNAVSFNGMFKLIYSDNHRNSEIYLKPKGIKKEESNHPVDLLTYQHRGSVENVLEKVKELPNLIEFFIEQVVIDAERISVLNNPDDIRKYLSLKVKFAKKTEFLEYKDQVFKKLMGISVDSTFQLFELLREVDDLFEHKDIVSRDFWRMKLYETLIEGR